MSCPLLHNMCTVWPQSSPWLGFCEGSGFSWRKLFVLIFTFMRVTSASKGKFGAAHVMIQPCGEQCRGRMTTYSSWAHAQTFRKWGKFSGGLELKRGLPTLSRPHNVFRCILVYWDWPLMGIRMHVCYFCVRMSIDFCEIRINVVPSMCVIVYFKCMAFTPSGSLSVTHCCVSFWIFVSVHCAGCSPTVSYHALWDAVLT